MSGWIQATMQQNTIAAKIRVENRRIQKKFCPVIMHHCRIIWNYIKRDFFIFTEKKFTRIGFIHPNLNISMIVFEGIMANCFQGSFMKCVYKFWQPTHTLTCYFLTLINIFEISTTCPPLFVNLFYERLLRSFLFLWRNCKICFDPDVENQILVCCTSS